MQNHLFKTWLVPFQQIATPQLDSTTHAEELEAPQATQSPTRATQRHTSWAAVAAETITALPTTQPETASNTSYTEAQIQASLASQEPRLEQRLEQILKERLARYDQQLNQMITMLQELVILMCSTPQDPLQPPSQTVSSSMRKQRRIEPTVILHQGDNMSDALIAKEDQTQNRTCHYMSQRLHPSKEPLHPTAKAAPGTELSQLPPPP
ncbi:hypothetical protein IV203_025433 [Nitzschia inconspicua]|uniref:Uncharacterized protein n=1 Tax=Nitzschia inconspicua TaxID=303405 RepID=A0A9K3K9N3_9STRA|nr:hypothetical protein IV203_028215 [Nitzschia inconspicua]KAG7362549.1 hypothetical protein IV203_025433 [Nitzschia inconspicua]